MPGAALLALLLVGQPAPDTGYLTVRSDMPGLTVYLEGDYVGVTPIDRLPVAAGFLMLSIASNDSLEVLYDGLRTGGVGRKLSSVWSLAGINAGTHRIEVVPGHVTDVFIDHGAVVAAPYRAKCLTGCAVGGVLGLGAVLGFLIGLLVAN